MKIFAIRDEEDISKKNLAFLLYYENSKQFYIEVPAEADPWETPLLIETFVKRGERTIGAYWSRLWVQQRIIPTDRQNLGQILKENHLEAYDEYDLLMLGEGRCAQDNYYLVPISEEELPDEVWKRTEKRIEEIVPLNNGKILVMFRNGEIRKCDIKQIIGKNLRFDAILDNFQLFSGVKIQTGGYGISWGEGLDISNERLYACGEYIPLLMEDFVQFVSGSVVNTSEATELLGCSRQNIDDLIRREKLHPIKVSPQTKLFLKSEILKRKW